MTVSPTRPNRTFCEQRLPFPTLSSMENLDLSSFATPPLTPKLAMDTKNAEYYKVGEGTSIPLEQINMKPAGGVTLTPELFERLYLSPRNIKKQEDPKRGFANPTPVALAGLLMCTTPLSMVLLGWHGAGNLGAANIGTYFYFGGLLLLLGGIGEFILGGPNHMWNNPDVSDGSIGNSFPTVAFLSYGSFWFTFGATLDPQYGAYAAYASDPSHPLSGLSSPMFASTFAFVFVAIVMLTMVFTIASLRTNVVLFLILFLLIPVFSLLAAAFFAFGHSNPNLGKRLQHVGAGGLLVVSFLGWYLFTGLVLETVDFPVSLPLGDLSTVIKGGSERAKKGKQFH